MESISTDETNGACSEYSGRTLEKLIGGNCGVKYIAASYSCTIQRDMGMP